MNPKSVNPNAKRILIVDDEVGFTRLVKLNLEQTGDFIVQAENDSSKALQVARTFKPHLILLDIVMPKIDGGDVAAKIKEDIDLRNTPIVFLTALVTNRETCSSNMMGGFPFLAKPISLDKLIECIDNNLNPKAPSTGFRG